MLSIWTKLVLKEEDDSCNTLTISIFKSLLSVLYSVLPLSINALNVLISLLLFSACQTNPSCPSNKYSSEAIAYFLEVALNYPKTDTTHIIKWNQNIRIAIHGSPTSNDKIHLQQIISEINDLIAPIQLQLEEKSANMHVHFTSPPMFEQYEPYFQNTNKTILNGITFVYPNAKGEILKANILINTLQRDSQKRAHTLREEITQSLGLLTDSWAHPNSIFYEGLSYSNAFASIDTQLIQLLYLPHIGVGQSGEEVWENLCQDVESDYKN